MTLDQTRDDAQNTFVFHDLDISKAYEEATGTSIVFDLDIPGFDAEWRIDLAKEYTRSFAAVRARSDNESASSELSQAVNAPSGKPQRAVRPAIAKRHRPL
jgi:hypothetical protein